MKHIIEKLNSKWDYWENRKATIFQEMFDFRQSFVKRKRPDTRLIDGWQNETRSLAINECCYWLFMRFPASTWTLRVSHINRQFPEVVQNHETSDKRHAGLSCRHGGAIRRRVPFCAASAPMSTRHWEAKPQIETAIWRRPTWIDECTDACFASVWIKADLYHSRWPCRMIHPR